jgi:hypothetical protein
MYETIILAVCLAQTQSICKEVNISVEADPAGSLHLPFHCARRGQMEAQMWIAENPSWHVERWSCQASHQDLMLRDDLVERGPTLHRAPTLTE